MRGAWHSRDRRDVPPCGAYPPACGAVQRKRRRGGDRRRSGSPRGDRHRGWAHGKVFILPDAQAAEEAELPKKALVVAQTTIRRDRFDSVLQVLRRRVPDLTQRITICAATSQRQQEAEKLSSEADVMVVVGGKNSSNTQKLLETCRLRCQAFHSGGNAGRRARPSGRAGGSRGADCRRIHAAVASGAGARAH